MHGGRQTGHVPDLALYLWPTVGLGLHPTGIPVLGFAYLNCASSQKCVASRHHVRLNRPESCHGIALERSGLQPLVEQSRSLKCCHCNTVLSHSCPVVGSFHVYTGDL